MSLVSTYSVHLTIPGVARITLAGDDDARAHLHFHPAGTEFSEPSVTLRPREVPGGGVAYDVPWYYFDLEYNKFPVILDLLRNEGPIGFAVDDDPPQTIRIFTYDEHPGEGE